MNGYEKITNKMLEIKPNLIGDYIVEIWVDGRSLIKEIVTFSPNSAEWLNDWWEGEDVFLEDFIKVDDVAF